MNEFDQNLTAEMISLLFRIVGAYIENHFVKPI